MRVTDTDVIIVGAGPTAGDPEGQRFQRAVVGGLGDRGADAGGQLVGGSAVVVGYVDDDPIVLAHARPLLISTPEGACTYIDADARDPETILVDPRLTGTIDLSEPVALMLFGIMHFLPDSDDPRSILARYLAALPSGSYLAIQHPTTDFYPPGVGSQNAYRGAGIPFQYRSKDEFARFLDGLELVDPGITPMVEWRPELEPGPQPSPSQAGAYAALARKP